MRRDFPRIREYDPLWILVCLLLPFLSSITVAAQETAFPESVHYLPDYSKVLTEEDEKRLERPLFELERRAHIEFRAILVPQTRAMSSSAYAEKVCRDRR